MEKYSKLSAIEAILFIIILTINKIILNIPKTIIKTTGSSAWINVIYISVIMIVFGLIIVKLFDRFKNSDIIDISEFLGGNFLKSIITILFLTLFIFTTSTVLRIFSEALKNIYFHNSPLMFIISIFLIGTVVANVTGFSSIVRTNLLIAPIILISILFIFILASKNFVFERLTPILGFGTNETFFIGLSNIFSYSGITYIFFLMPMLKDKNSFKKITITSIILSSIYLFLSVVSLLLAFPYIINSDEIISIYLITRLIELGDFIKRVDALFIFLWILSFFSYLSINLFFILNIFKKFTSFSNINILTYAFAFIIFGLSQIPKNIDIINFINEYFYKYFILILIFLISPLLLVGANIKSKLKKESDVILNE